MRKFKKVVAPLLALAMCLGLTACGGAKAGGSAAPSQAENSAADPAATATPEHPKQPDTSYKLTNAEGFINGWAYIEFQDTRTGSEYQGVIDTEGKLHTYFNDSPSVSHVIASYEDGTGRFYGKKDGAYSYYMIDSEGQVHTYAEFEDVAAVCRYPDGYSCLIEHKSGFDGEENITHIYDPDGTELMSMSGSSIPYSDNPGGGIILFVNNDVQTSPSRDLLYGADLYFSQSDTWVRGQVFGGQTTCELKDGIWVYRCSSNDDRFELCNGEVCYADVQGNTYTITVPEEYGKYPRYLCATNGVLLFTDTDDRGFSNGTVYCYNTATGQWALYQGAYQDNIDEVSYAFVVAGDGCFALLLTGADREVYWILLNEKLEDLTEPTQSTVAKTSDGVVYAIEGSKPKRYEIGSKLKRYDISDEFFQVIESGGYSLHGIENGIICMSYTDQNGDLVIGYYRADGSPAFEIDFSTGTEVTMAS